VRKKIGECLVQAGLITETDLQAALVEHKRSGERLGSVLVRMNLATERQIAKALAYRPILRRWCSSPRTSRSSAPASPSRSRRTC
jgi:type IV pilus assembly protein PilB